MATCETCRNSYDISFKIVMAGKSHTFDRFECAITALAPQCAHCGCKIVGHGVEAGGTMDCCPHCARKSDVAQVQDRA